MWRNHKNGLNLQIKLNLSEIKKSCKGKVIKIENEVAIQNSDLNKNLNEQILRTLDL